MGGAAPPRRRFHPQRAGGGGHFAARFFQVVNAARDHAALGAIEHGGFLGDQALLVGFQAGVVKGAPAERIAGLDDFVKRLALAFAQPDGFLRAQIGAHDFQQRKTSAADLAARAAG